MIKKTLFWLSSIVTILSFAFHGFAADVKWYMANEYQEI